MTGQQRMLTPLRYMILPLVFPGVHISLIFARLFYVPDLDTDFVCRFFCLPGWTHRFWLCILPFTLSRYTKFDYRYLNFKWGTQRVWPVSRGCSIFHSTCLCICRRSLLPYTRFCNCLLDYNCVLQIVNFAILYFEGFGSTSWILLTSSQLVELKLQLRPWSCSWGGVTLPSSIHSK
jgi:hypothetical protein